MNTRLDPKTFGLSARTVVEQVDDMTLAIVIDRKNRIIMADGKKILEKAGKIKNTHPDKKILLKSSAPICSKTIRMLENEGINPHSS